MSREEIFDDLQEITEELRKAKEIKSLSDFEALRQKWNLFSKKIEDNSSKILTEMKELLLNETTRITQAFEELKNELILQQSIQKSFKTMTQLHRFQKLFDREMLNYDEIFPQAQIFYENEKQPDEAISGLLSIILRENNLSDLEEMKRFQTILRVAVNLKIKFSESFFEELMISKYQKQITTYLFEELKFDPPPELVEIVKSHYSQTASLMKLLGVTAS